MNADDLQRAVIEARKAAADRTDRTYHARATVSADLGSPIRADRAAWWAHQPVGGTATLAEATAPTPCGFTGDPRTGGPCVLPVGHTSCHHGTTAAAAYCARVFGGHR